MASQKHFLELVAILTKLYSSKKRSLFKYDVLDYHFPTAAIFMKKRKKPRQEVMLEIYNLRNKKELATWNIKYIDSKTLLFSRNMFNVRLRF